MTCVSRLAVLVFVGVVATAPEAAAQRISTIPGGVGNRCCRVRSRHGDALDSLRELRRISQHRLLERFRPTDCCVDPVAH